MADPEQARGAQLQNIEAKLGLSLDGLREAVTSSSKIKHGEIRAWLIETYGLGYGDANAVAQHVLARRGDAVSDEPGHDPLANIYSGKEGASAGSSRSADRSRHAVGRLRGGAEKGLCRAAAKEAVRDTWAQDGGTR